MVNFPIEVKRNGKHIIIKFINPVDVTSNITIKAKKTISSVTKLKGIVVNYREKVS